MEKRIRLKIEEPNSKYEREADRVANDIMKKKNHNPQYDAEAQKVVPFTHEEALQFLEERIAETKEASKRLENVVDDSEMISIKSSGKSLTKTEKEFFEPRFGYDFSNVKIHDDEKAHKMAEELNAKAFTIGNDIFFNESEYQPETIEGQKLLAHEMTHVKQQKKQNLNQIQLKSKSKSTQTTSIDNAIERLNLIILQAEKLLNEKKLSNEEKGKLLSGIAEVKKEIRRFQDLKKQGQSRAEILAGIGIAAAAIISDDITGIGVADDPVLILLGLAAVATLIFTNSPATKDQLADSWDSIGLKVDNLSKIIHEIYSIQNGEVFEDAFLASQAGQAEKHIAGQKKQIEEHIFKINNPDPNKHGGPEWIPKWLRDIARALREILKKAKHLRKNRGHKYREALKYVKETAEKLRPLAEKHNIPWEF